MNDMLRFKMAKGLAAFAVMFLTITGTSTATASDTHATSSVTRVDFDVPLKTQKQQHETRTTIDTSSVAGMSCTVRITSRNHYGENPSKHDTYVTFGSPNGNAVIRGIELGGPEDKPFSVAGFVPDTSTPVEVTVPTPKSNGDYRSSVGFRGHMECKEVVVKITPPPTPPRELLPPATPPNNVVPPVVEEPPKAKKPPKKRVKKPKPRIASCKVLSVDLPKRTSFQELDGYTMPIRVRYRAKGSNPKARKALRSRVQIIVTPQRKLTKVSKRKGGKQVKRAVFNVKNVRPGKLVVRKPQVYLKRPALNRHVRVNIRVRVFPMGSKKPARGCGFQVITWDPLKADL